MKRIPALFLSALMLLGVLALPALADSAPPPERPAAAAPAGSAVSAEPGAKEDPAAGEAAPEVPEGGAEQAAPAGAEPPADTAIAGTSVQYARDPQNTADTIQFERLRASMEKFNPQILSLQGQIKDLSDTSAGTGDMWDLIVGLSQMKDGVNAALASLDEEALGSAYGPLSTSLKAQSMILEIQIETMKGQRSSVIDAGDSIESAKNNLQSGINQLISGAETLYVAVISMEDALRGVERGLASLDRAVAIVEKQQELGMASAYDVESVRHQRAQVESQMESLQYNIKTNKITLEQMCDMSLTGNVQLGPLPMPTDAELGAVNYDKALSTATGRNADAANAQIAYNTKSSGANRNALNAARSGFAAKFKVVCLAVPENVRLVDAAQETVDFQQRTFDIAAKKYDLGMASHEDCLSAQNDLDSAKDDLTAARRNLFTAYRAYLSATQYGLV